MGELQTTYLHVKPEITRNFDSVVRHLKEVDLMPARYADVDWDSAMVHTATPKLYPDARGETLEALIAYFAGKRSCVLELTAPNAIERLQQCVGESPNPMECSLGTLRNMFGSPIPLLSKNAVIWLNGSDAPRDEAESARYAAIFFRHSIN